MSNLLDCFWPVENISNLTFSFSQCWPVWPDSAKCPTVEIEPTIDRNINGTLTFAVCLFMLFIIIKTWPNCIFCIAKHDLASRILGGLEPFRDKRKSLNIWRYHRSNQPLLYEIMVNLVDYAFAPPKATVANFGLRSYIKFGVKVRETWKMF